MKSGKQNPIAKTLSSRKYYQRIVSSTKRTLKEKARLKEAKKEVNET